MWPQKNTAELEKLHRDSRNVVGAGTGYFAEDIHHYTFYNQIPSWLDYWYTHIEGHQDQSLASMGRRVGNSSELQLMG